MPTDEVPGPRGSRNLVEAQIKSLRAYRKWCRYMPFVLATLNMNRFTSVEDAKMHVASIWKQNERVRNIEQIDNFTVSQYEKLYAIQENDVWMGGVMDWLCPQKPGTINTY